MSSTVVTNLTWDLIKRLRDRVKVKLVLDGILAFEDANRHWQRVCSGYSRRCSCRAGYRSYTRNPDTSITLR